MTFVGVLLSIVKCRISVATRWCGRTSNIQRRIDMAHGDRDINVDVMLFQ